MTKKEFKSYYDLLSGSLLIWGFGVGIIWSLVVLRSPGQSALWNLVGGVCTAVGTIAFLINHKKTKQIYDSLPE